MFTVNRDRPNISIVGLGYVGLAYAVAFSLHGFRVIGVDIDSEKLKVIRSGSLEGFPREAISRALSSSLSLTADYSELRDVDVVFIAVNTPTNQDGSQDLAQVISALKSLWDVWSSSLRGYRVVVLKSTVLPGTTRFLARYAKEFLGLPVPDQVGFVHSPEFLRADRAFEDVLRPSRVVVGGIDERSSNYVADLYRELYKRIGYEPPIFVVSPEEAELVKYASNFFLALKTVYGNFIGLLCKYLEDCDAWKVMEIVGLDPRIGRSHIIPGMPYGGPCLVKDVFAFAKSVLEKTGLDFVKYVHNYNELLLDKIVEDIEDKVGTLRGKKVAVLGVAFKPGSAEVKDSSSIKLSKKLLSIGSKVYIHDVNEVALRKAQKMLEDAYVLESYEQLKDVDVILVTVGYREYAQILQNVSTRALIIDVTGTIEGGKVYRFYTSQHPQG